MRARAGHVGARVRARVARARAGHAGAANARAPYSDASRALAQRPSTMSCMPSSTAAR